ncbi:MAG: hypothetical protein ACP5I8_09085 [Phycisphaerae bacterium]
MVKPQLTMRVKHFLRHHRMAMVLAVLVLALIVVYGRIVWLHETAPAAQRHQLPEVAAIIAQARGKPLAFPLWLIDHRVAGKMTAHQRQTLALQRRAEIEAFFLTYAKAPPAQQQAMILQTQALLAVMHVKIKLRHVSKTIANALIHGDPQMNASVLQFLAALRHNR